MEPPTKRLRILKSVQVDESDPEYRRKKREGEGQLRSRFEDIFAKYESMPESMSDEIDLRAGTVVVDRGHIRGLRTEDLRAAQFLEDMISENAHVGHDYDSDEIDELAPPEALGPPATRTPRRANEEPEGAQENSQADIPPPVAPAIATPQLPVQMEIKLTLTPEVMQLAQQPQTPADQQGQSNLLMALIQQAITFTSSADNALHVGLPRTSFLPPATPTTADRVAPATDPKWYFPPLPDRPSQPPLAQSSPIPVLTTTRKRRRSLTRSSCSGPAKRKPTGAGFPATPTEKASTHTLQSEPAQDEADDLVIASVDRRMTKRKPRNTYVFTDEDNQYIIKQKEMYKLPWAEIRGGRLEWNDWPLTALQNHYRNHLKGRNPVLADDIETSEMVTEEVVQENEPREQDDLVVGANGAFDMMIDSNEPQEQPKPKSQPRRREYVFSDEEELYIIEQREVHDLTWLQIRDSRKNWKNWPPSAIYNHYCNHLGIRHQKLGDSLGISKDANDRAFEENQSYEQEDAVLRAATAVKVSSAVHESPEQPVQNKTVAQSIENLISPSQRRQLLTPNSLEHPESSDSQKDVRDLVLEHAGSDTVPAIDCDDGEMEPLLLADSAEPKEVGPMEADAMIPSSPPPDMVLPSVETDAPMDKDEDELAETDTPMNEDEDEQPSRFPTPLRIGVPAQIPRKPFTIFVKPNLDSETTPLSKPLPSGKRPQPKTLLAYQIDSDFDSEEDNVVDTGSSPLKSAAKKSRSTTKVKRPAVAHPSPSNSELDELGESPTQHIKREPLTPRPSFLDGTALPQLNTPKSAPPPPAMTLHSSGTTKSTSKLSKKEYRQIMSGWSEKRKGQKGTPGPKKSQSVKKRTSVSNLKNRYAELESEDELVS